MYRHAVGAAGQAVINACVSRTGRLSQLQRLACHSASTTDQAHNMHWRSESMGCSLTAAQTWSAGGADLSDAGRGCLGQQVCLNLHQACHQVDSCWMNPFRHAAPLRHRAADVRGHVALQLGTYCANIGLLHLPSLKCDVAFTLHCPGLAVLKQRSKP